MEEKTNIYKFIWKFAIRHRIALFFLLVFFIANDLMGVIITPYLNRNLINEASSSSPNFKLGLIYIIVYAIISSLVHIFDSLFFRIKFNAINKVQKEMNEDLFYYTTKQSMNYFNNSFSGSINDKINSLATETGTIINIMVDLLSVIIITITSLVIYVGINIYMALCFIFISIIYFFATSHVRKSINKAAKQLAENRSSFFGLINDDFTNIVNIKFFSNEKKEIELVKESSDRVDSSNFKVLKSVAGLNAVTCAMSFLYIFIVLMISGHMLMNRKIAMGDFMFIMILTSILRFVLDTMTNNMSIILEAKGKMESNIATIIKPLEIKNKENAENIGVSAGKIIFKNVSFSYIKNGGVNVK